MKMQLCCYSGFKIYPGHGKTLIRVDGKSFTFINSKCESGFKMKRNPRKIRWTVLYRRKHKKGLEIDAAKKKTRRTKKFERAIVGASLTDIMAKRNMKPEVRKAQREQAIRAAKEKKMIKQQKKVQPTTKGTKGKTPKSQQKIVKPMPKSSRPGHGGRR